MASFTGEGGTGGGGKDADAMELEKLRSKVKTLTVQLQEYEANAKRASQPDLGTEAPSIAALFARPPPPASISSSGRDARVIFRPKFRILPAPLRRLMRLALVSSRVSTPCMTAAVRSGAPLVEPMAP